MPTPNLDFYRGAEYASDIPTLASVLDHAHGERICSPEEIYRYCDALEGSSDRALLAQYGRSAEGRPLIYLAVSTPENLARVEAAKADLRRLADPRLCDRDEAAEIIARAPAVTWVAANVHGGEHSSSEAALLLAYHLLAGEDERSRQIREETIVVIDPLQNPDGRARSVGYYYSSFGIAANPDPNAAEHHWPWPGPRGNHYLFDLNRDWMLLTQPETPPKVRAFLEWRPQVYADLHEMGHNSTFYFFPPAPPVHGHYPDVTMRWWEKYGRAIAAWFDEYGFAYYTRARFDAFYPGYGESWPSFHGATGMTFEQASVRGIAIRREDETELSLRDALHHHFIAALAACHVTAQEREARLWDHYAFHEDGVLHGRQGDVRAYLIPPRPGARRLAGDLARQGIEVGVALQSFAARGARDAITGEPLAGELPAGTFVYPLDQPYSRFLRAVLEPRTELPEGFVAEETEHDAARLPDRFYDITAWSRALALGLPLVEASTIPEVATASCAPEDASSAGAGDPSQPLTVDSRDSRVAWVLPATSAGAAAAALRLRREGFLVHCARKPFTTAGREYRAGAFVVRSCGQPDLHTALQAAVAPFDDDVETVSVPTLWTESGIDLGSEDVIPLKSPKIAVLYDWPVSSLSFGWIACLLERRYEIPFTAVRRDCLGGVDFRDYDVLLLPNGDGYEKALDADQGRWLKAWVEAGGVLVGIGRAAAYLCRPEAELISVRVVDDLRQAGKEPEPKAAEPEKEKKPPVPHPFRPVRVPGAFLRVDLDAHHPLTFGYQDPTSVFYDGSLLLAAGTETHAAARFAAREHLAVSGFVWERMAEALPGHLWAAEERLGRGHVVLFASDPAYRASWDAMHRFLLNALLVMPSVKRPG